MTGTTNAKRGPELGRQRLPERFCNLDRLLADMEARDLDGLVVTTPLNVFYLTSINAIAHKGDEPRPYVVIPPRPWPTNTRGVPRSSNGLETTAVAQDPNEAMTCSSFSARAILPIHM